MRSSIVLAMLAFGCTGNTLKIDNSGDALDLGAGHADLAVDLRSVDLKPIGGGPDLPAAPQLGCADVLQCANTCSTQTCLTKCLKMSTPQAQALFMKFSSCLTDACVNTANGMNGPCAGNDQTACNDCLTEAETGTSASGTTNGPCTDSQGRASQAATCGACIDPLIACSNDMTM